MNIFTKIKNATVYQCVLLTMGLPAACCLGTVSAAPLTAAVMQQQVTVTGKVTDSEGKSLPGVTVTVKGGSAVTATNAQGIYKITVPNTSSVLIFRFVGYLTKELGAGDKNTLDVILIDDVTKLSEVVVLGYGSAAKKDITGSVGQVKIEDLQRAPVISFDQALAGRVAGVQVASNDGQPGAEGINVVIRGANSLTQSNAPLYVIDGFPTEYLQNSSINPDDIKSISILKDASATAIYGARGANGVVVIETKRGLNGKPVITYTGNFGYQRVGKTIPTMGSYDFVNYQLERFPTSAPAFYLTNGKTLESYRNIQGVDWQKQLYRDAAMQTHNISLRGGNAQTKYAISGSLFDQPGIIINTGQKRSQARIVIDQTLSDKATVGVNVNYSGLGYFGQIANASNTGTGASSYLLYSVWGYRPVNATAADLDSDDSLEDNLVDGDINPTSDYRVNPIISVQNEYRKNFQKNISGNAYFTYEFIKNLKLRITGGIDSHSEKADIFYNSLTAKGTPLLPGNIYGQYGSLNYSERNTWVNENTLTWNKEFNSRHRLDLLAGATMQGSRTTSFGFSSQQVPNAQLNTAGLGNGIPLSNTTAGSVSTLASFLGRANYSYKSRYLLTGSFRADASSRFALSNRWGYFPSGAFAWRADQEDFVKNIKWLSEAKFRASYGLTGNNRIGDFAIYPSLSLPISASYSYNNATPTPAIVQASLGNSALKWETTAQTDLGIDLGFLNNRISITIDAYNKITSNLLLNADLPYLSGFSTVYENIGKIQNRGLEISLNTVNLQTKNFTWQTNFNISFNRNKVLDLTDNQTELPSIVSWESYFNTVPLYVARLGQPAGMFYGFTADGLYQVSDFDKSTAGVYTLKANVPTNGTARAAIQPGDIKYKDYNGDGVVDANDKTVIGNGNPKFFGGFTNNFNYKNFSLSVFVQGVYGNQIYNANQMMFEGNTSSKVGLNQYASYTNRWTFDNQSSNMFRAGGQGPTGYYSNYYLEDGSYLRLKTVMLGYKLPTQLANKIALKELSFSLTAQNLYTWTKYSGMDPEVSVRNSALTPGFDYSAYPRARTLVLGIKATL